MRKKFPFTWQSDSMQCGAACLHMICKYWGQEYSLDHLVKLCNIGINGTSLLNMNEVANMLCFKTICKKTDIETLMIAPLPCILHWNKNHFVVLYKVKNDQFYIANPSKGFETYNISDFQHLWIGDDENQNGIAMFMKPTETFFKQKDIEKKVFSNLNFLLKYGKPHYKQFILIIIGLFLVGFLQLVLPFLTQSIVDVGIKERDISLVGLMLLGQLMLVIGRTAIDFARRWVLLHISLRMHIFMIGDFFIKLLKLPMYFFDTKLLGDLMQRMNDHNRLNTFLTQEMLSAAYSTFTFIALTVVLLCYNTVIFFIFLIGSILYILWIIPFLKRRKLIDYEMFEVQAVNSNITYDFITSVQEIKLQNCEEKQKNKWTSAQGLLFDVQLKSLKLQQKLEAGSVLINELKNIVITFTAAVAVIDGQMTLGMMMALLFIIGQLNSPIEQLISFVYSLQDVKISLERIKAIHEKPNEDVECKQRCLVNEMQGIEFSNVSFSYNTQSICKTISDVNIHIPQGKVTAIVGTSGSGKTTLIRLMLGYNAIAEGKLLIGGSDINHINKKWWRSKCGVVMQDGFIFSESIAQNIAIGDDNINNEKLFKAAEIACIKDYVMSLPQKFNTKIGRDGVELSKGQKQRILIARAVYKNPEYIFLDEATNSLDANNEKSIVDNLRNFYEGKTVVIAAHRLCTVRDADQIIVIDKGIIVEVGNHETLITKQGMYRKLVKNQLAL